VLAAGAVATATGDAIFSEARARSRVNSLDAGDVQLQHAQLLDAFIVAEALLEANAKELLGGLGLLAGSSSSVRLRIFSSSIIDLLSLQILSAWFFSDFVT
jgi:hypothetical protein